MLVEKPERSLQAMDDGRALCVGQSFIVNPTKPVGQPDVAAFREEHRIVDEAPEGDEAVDAARVFVVSQDALDAQHDPTSTLNGSCLPGSYRRRVFDDAS